MSPGIIVISGENTVAACAAAMSARRTHAVLVADEKTRQPLGWVFHRDVLKHLKSDPYATRAADVVSQEPAYVHPEDTAEEAADKMDTEGLTHLLVAQSEDAIPEGVLSSWDLVSYYAAR
jgi:CBS domain-containing protein